MRQAITTKFIGPTNHRGARIKAACEARTITLPWDHSQGVAANHAHAAEVLATSLGWFGRWYGGATVGSMGCAFTLCDEPTFTVAAEG